VISDYYNIGGSPSCKKIQCIKYKNIDVRNSEILLFTFVFTFRFNILVKSTRAYWYSIE